MPRKIDNLQAGRHLLLKFQNILPQALLQDGRVNCTRCSCSSWFDHREQHIIENSSGAAHSTFETFSTCIRKDLLSCENVEIGEGGGAPMQPVGVDTAVWTGAHSLPYSVTADKLGFFCISNFRERGFFPLQIPLLYI